MHGGLCEGILCRESGQAGLSRCILFHILEVNSKQKTKKKKQLQVENARYVDVFRYGSAPIKNSLSCCAAASTLSSVHNFGRPDRIALNLGQEV